MANQLDLIQEAVKRGLPLPPDKQQLYDEAVKRGLIQDMRPNGSAAAAPAQDQRGTMQRVADFGHSVGTGVAQGAIAAANMVNEIPAALENKMGSMFGYTPEQIDAMRQARAMVGVGSPRSTQDVQAKVEQATGPFRKPQGTLEEYGNTTGQFIPGMFMGPGATWGEAIVSNALPTALGALGSETAGQWSKGQWYEPYARLAGGVGGGLLGSSAYNAATRPGAPIPDVSPGAQRRVARGLLDTFPDEQTALARAKELGPDAMVMNLGDRPAMQAGTVARYPGESANIVKGAVRQQLDGSGDRALADWNNAIGPATSRYENELAAAQTKAGTSSLYEIASGRQVDPTPVRATILKQLTESGNDPQARAAIKEVSDLLLDPNSGGLTFDPKTGAPSIINGTQQFVDDAGALVNARQRTAEIITKLGKEVSNSPADDLYQVGKRTGVGSRLNRIYKAINDVLHEDDTLAAADKVWGGAERTRNAFEFGRTKLLGRGDTPVEPEALVAKLANPNLTTEERSAILRGLSRKGRSLLGDIGPNRNDGKAMGDTIATENNLARIGAVAGPDAADKVRGMAAREDLFAAQGNRAIGNSVTAESQFGANEFPSPLLGTKDFSLLGRRTATGMAIEGVARLVNMLSSGAVSQYRAQLANDAAKLLTARGAERDRIVTQLMTYANTLPKDSAMKSIILQTVAPSVSATVPARTGRQ